MAVSWLLCAAVTVPAMAAVGPPEDDPPAASDAPRGWIFFPVDDLYPQYIADPLRPQSAVMLAGYPGSGIPDSGDSRFLLRLGGRYSIARLHPAGHTDRGFEIDFDGGFFGQFDLNNSLDNIGWDGLFGLRLSYKGDGPWAFSLGSRHDSGHVGDEYAERTGRERIGYTREEIVLGASWTPNALWRAYAEAGYGYHHIESENAFRMQAGVEHTGRARLWRGGFPWYAALDMNAYKEDSVRVRATAQLGVIFPTGRGTDRYRAALEFGSGRSLLGEFSMHDESYIGLGWYFDF